MWIQPRPCSWWQHINDNWDDRNWQLNFRMRRTSFMELCDILRPSLIRQRTHYRCPVPVELRVAICLWRLATNLEFRSISHLFGVGISTACIVTQQVVTAINRVMQHLYIKTPSDAELKTIVQGYRDKWRFPQVAGAIDGTHIGILTPADHPADYYNRKGFYSVLLQGVVDHKLKFWDINVGWPGTVHDARVFASSSLYHRGQNGTLLPGWTETFEGVDVPLVILGDAAYPLLSWLMKPFPEGSGATWEQTQFNHRLSQARVTVKRAFGRLKGRWRCLLKKCNAHISLVSHIIAACCVLHNFCEVHNEEWEDDEPAEDEDGLLEPENHHQANSGGHIRNALCAYFTQ
ncbi:uncharacterized protein KZ484_010982 isoform 2-T2 [Pholidichthys leucotaenia]